MLVHSGAMFVGTPHVNGASVAGLGTEEMDNPTSINNRQQAMTCCSWFQEAQFVQCLPCSSDAHFPGSWQQETKGEQVGDGKRDQE